MVSLVLLIQSKSWSFWLGGYLYLIFSVYGYWIDYHQGISWRKPIRKDILFPSITLYLGSLMFYWWPLAILHRPLWFVFAGRFVLSTILIIRSH